MTQSSNTMQCIHWSVKLTFMHFKYRLRKVPPCGQYSAQSANSNLLKFHAQMPQDLPGINRQISARDKCHILKSLFVPGSIYIGQSTRLTCTSFFSARSLSHGFSAASACMMQNKKKSKFLSQHEPPRSLLWNAEMLCELRRFHVKISRFETFLRVRYHRG